MAPVTRSKSKSSSTKDNRHLLRRDGDVTDPPKESDFVASDHWVTRPATTEIDDGTLQWIGSRENLSQSGAPPPLPPATEDAGGIPTYTVDLSLPPSERYVKLALDFKDHITDITVLFDEVIHGVSPNIKIGVVKFVAKLLLWRVYSREETQELRGISKAVGVDMFLLVALNTFLDLFMGCTSGGVRIRGDEQEGETRMVHFRTLDWGMDSLRRILVNLEFVRSPNTEVIARSITYAGFLGVLTGVRKNLSISLNFRPDHNGDSFVSHFRFYMHHILVLFGFRPSIASTLRRYLLIDASPPAPAKRKWRRRSPQEEQKDGAATPESPTAPSLTLIAQELPTIPSTAAYIILCDGTSTMVFEKDLRTAVAHSRRDFIVATNHDRAHENDNQPHLAAQQTSAQLAGMAGLIEESVHRKGCMRKRWRKAVKKASGRDPDSAPDEDFGVAVKLADIERWVDQFPTTNECTHFSCVMDPTQGRMAYVKRYVEPIESDW